jgi:hypothetical protein
VRLYALKQTLHLYRPTKDLLHPTLDPKRLPHEPQFLLHRPPLRLGLPPSMSLPLKDDHLALPTSALDLFRHGDSLFLRYYTVNRALEEEEGGRDGRRVVKGGAVCSWTGISEQAERGGRARSEPR